MCQAGAIGRRCVFCCLRWLDGLSLCLCVCCIVFRFPFCASFFSTHHVQAYPHVCFCGRSVHVNSIYKAHCRNWRTNLETHRLFVFVFSRRGRRTFVVHSSTLAWRPSLHVLRLTRQFTHKPHQPRPHRFLNPRTHLQGCGQGEGGEGGQADAAQDYQGVGLPVLGAGKPPS